MITLSESLRMATLMRERDGEIVKAIEQVSADNHGVVALKFSNACNNMAIEILDEPFEPDVRVYPGEGLADEVQ